MSKIDETVKNMIERGQDPKDMLIAHCDPECKFWKDKLGRCEATLKAMVGADPEKSCMYPLRDYVTCVEACVQPKIHKYLKGQETGFFS